MVLTVSNYKKISPSCMNFIKKKICFSIKIRYLKNKKREVVSSQVDIKNIIISV